MLFCSLIVASYLAAANGLAVAPIAGCLVCGNGKVVEAPNTIFDFPGQPAVSCSVLQQAGLTGQIPLDQCDQLPPIIEVCDCAEGELPVATTDVPVGIPTDAPVVAPTPTPVVVPTDAPVGSPTDAPVIPSTPTTVAPFVFPTSPAPIDAPTTPAPTPVIVFPTSPAPIDAPTTPAPTPVIVFPTSPAPIDAPTTLAPTPVIVFPTPTAPIVAPTTPAPVIAPSRGKLFAAFVLYYYGCLAYKPFSHFWAAPFMGKSKGEMGGMMTSKGEMGGTMASKKSRRLGRKEFKTGV